MGATATFYLVPASRLVDLDEAVTPRIREVKTRTRLFFSRSHQIREDSRQAFLDQAARQLSPFAGPGSAFSLLDQFFARRGLCRIFASVRLAELTSSIALFDPSRAAAVLEALGRLKLAEAEVEAFLATELGVRDGGSVKAVFDASRQLSSWLTAVPGDCVGVLLVEAAAEDPFAPQASSGGGTWADRQGKPGA